MTRLAALGLAACLPAWSVAAAGDITSVRASVNDTDGIAVICNMALADTQRSVSWDEALTMGRHHVAYDVHPSAGTAFSPNELHSGLSFLGPLDSLPPVQVLAMVAFASMTIVNMTVLALLGFTLWRRIRLRR
jgi:hypothetical protein